MFFQSFCLYITFIFLTYLLKLLFFVKVCLVKYAVLFFGRLLCVLFFNVWISEKINISTDAMQFYGYRTPWYMSLRILFLKHKYVFHVANLKGRHHLKIKTTALAKPHQQCWPNNSVGIVVCACISTLLVENLANLQNGNGPSKLNPYDIGYIMFQSHYKIK